MIRRCDKCGYYMNPHLEYRESYTNTSSDKCIRENVDFIKPEIKMIRRRNDSST